MKAPINTALAMSSDTTSGDDHPSEVLRSTAYIRARMDGTPVISPRTSRRRRAVRWDSAEEARCRQEPDDADRDVDVEDETPGEVLDEPATEDRPHGRRDEHRHTEDAHHPAHVLGSDGLQDDGHADRHQHAPADALDNPEEDQLAEVLRDPAEHRRNGEGHHRDQVEPLGSPAVGRPAGERDHGPLGEKVAGDDPRDVRVAARVQVMLQGGDGDVDDRRVEDRHDRAGQHDRKRHPLVVDAAEPGVGEAHLVLRRRTWRDGRLRHDGHHTASGFQPAIRGAKRDLSRRATSLPGPRGDRP